MPEPRLEQLAAAAAIEMERQARQACPTYKRGAADKAIPTVEDLEALVAVRDGFNLLRRSFSPEVAEQFRRFDRTIGYLHQLIQGTVE